MNSDGLTPRAQALVAELTRYTRKHGELADRSHVEHLELLLQEEMEASCNALQRSRARS